MSLRFQYVQVAERVMERFSACFIPGAYLVETIPILKYIPSWMPGARGFKRMAAEGKAESRKMLDIPFERVKAEMVWLSLHNINSCSAYS